MIDVSIQRLYTTANTPTDAQFTQWLTHALADYEGCEVNVRLTTREESQALNAAHRGQDKPTNVLSFPTRMFDEVPEYPLGDIVICVEIVDQEAQAAQLLPTAHYAHMTIHGALHLLGFDHETDEEATEMEALETKLLQELGFANPYETEENK